MRIPKSYGDHKTDSCAYCGSQTFTKNKIGLNVCRLHKDTKEGPAYKCTCGSWLEILCGKFGNYGNCIKCGNISMSKILEFNADLDEHKQNKSAPKGSALATLGKKEPTQTTAQSINKKVGLRKASASEIKHGLLLD